VSFGRSRPRALFLGSGFAGHRAWFELLRSEVERDGRLDARFALVTGWRPGGRIEALTALPRVVRSRARVLSEVAALATFPRPDVIWTSAPAPLLLPFLWSQLGPLRRPMVVQMDWTREQQESMAPHYFHRAARPPLVTSALSMVDRQLYARATFVAPWSDWAAQSLRAGGVPADRIRVAPPGVDTARFLENPARWQSSGKLRLLLVGGDFIRKGGLLLIEAMAAGLAEVCELDIVTRDPVPSAAGVRVHRAEPGDPLLAELYGRAHLFVMPSIAECFGIATIEAMACGLPTIVSDVGASAEIVEDGVTGWLVTPTVEGVKRGIETALAQRHVLPGMGARGRAVVEQRFSADANARHVVDLLLEATNRFRAPRT